MHDQQPRSVPILDRITRYIPGYGGYQLRANRRSADRALRDAIADRVVRLKPIVEDAIRHAVDQADLGRIAPLENLVRRLDRLSQNLRAAGSGTDAFYAAKDFDAGKAEPLYALDLSLFELTDKLTARLESGLLDNEHLSAIEAEVVGLEAKLANRAALLQGIH